MKANKDNDINIKRILLSGSGDYKRLLNKNS